MISSSAVTSPTSRPLLWARAQAWQTNAALLFLGVLLFLLSRHLIFEYDTFTIGFSGTSGWSVWCYLLACFLVLTQPTDRYTFAIVIGVAVACRLTTLFSDPNLSSDIYRYVWDGIVQHAGINPYRYVPADPAISFLRGASEGNIYPAINRATYARTIYPPFAQIFFWVVTFISPTLTMMKVAMVLCEGVTAWSLVTLLRLLGRPREQIILYAWAPVLIWEIAASGHVDALAMALIGLALVARFRDRPVVTGIFLALAVLAKLYPLVLFPALYQRYPADRKTGRSTATLDWRMPVTMALIIAAGYALYSSVGLAVFGFLGGYVQEEGMASGARYFLLDLVQSIPGLPQIPAAAFLIAAALIFGALSLWAWRTASSRPDSPLPTAEGMQLLRPHQSAAFLLPACGLAAALMLLFSPHYAWYVVWLIPFYTLLPNLAMLGYVTGFFYLYTTELGAPGPGMFLANKILYAGTLALALLGILGRRVPWLQLRFWSPPARVPDPSVR